MRTADVQMIETQPKIVGPDGKPQKQPPLHLGRFRVQDERIDGLRNKAKEVATKRLKGRLFAVNFGSFDEATKRHVIIITCRKAGE